MCNWLYYTEPFSWDIFDVTLVRIRVRISIYLLTWISFDDSSVRTLMKLKLKYQMSFWKSFQNFIVFEQRQDVSWSFNRPQCYLHVIELSSCFTNVILWTSKGISILTIHKSFELKLRYKTERGRERLCLFCIRNYFELLRPDKCILFELSINALQPLYICT